MELQEVTKMEIGFRWHIAVDREVQRPPGYFHGVEVASRSSDKETIHASLEGHAETYDAACSQLEEAKEKVRSVVAEFGKPKKE